MEEKNLKTKWLHIRLSNDDFKAITKNYSGTTEQKLSAYCRKILLGEPMIKGYRNKSLDDLIEEFAQLNKDLNGIANNYNQAVHKLHTLQLPVQFQKWLIVYASQKETMMLSIEEIRVVIKKIAVAWLQL